VESSKVGHRSRFHYLNNRGANLDLAPGRHSLKGADAANVASVTMLKVLATHPGIRALPARLTADAEGNFCTPSHLLPSALTH